MKGSYRGACPDSAVAHIGTAHQNKSPWGAQPSQRDRDEPADRGLGRQVAGCCEGVETVARELVRRHIVPEVAGLCGLDQQVSDHVAELLLRPGDVLTSMQECRELGAVVPAVVGDERIGLEHCFEPLAGVAGLVPELAEMFEVAGDATLVPGEQDRFDVWEVLVQRRTVDAGATRFEKLASSFSAMVKLAFMRRYFRLSERFSGGT